MDTTTDTTASPTTESGSPQRDTQKNAYPIEILSQTLLFEGIEPDQIQDLLECQRAHMRSYRRNQYLWRAGDRPDSLRILCSGAAHVISIDKSGSRNIHGLLDAAEPFGVSFICAQVHHLPHSVIATAPSTVLVLNYPEIVTPCVNSCPAHGQLIRNLLQVLAQENLRLKRKMRIISKRQIRARVLAYLEDETARQNSPEITIPFNRQEMADYLGVERSALSAEISKMRRDGLIENERNRFVLRA